MAMDESKQLQRKDPYLPNPRIKGASPFVALHGIAGFHVVEEPISHVRMASMKVDKDISKYRVFTQGDGPSNKHSRFGTTCESH
jgi:hypothetical protein